ncbi:uncharacterized protein LOC122849609 [Aphidius gifuensis]|uniref:uncharacterized protein LOC122849609 n=1 Tax=Aphidius gifuensis TaxID=684658 RepID=UPI001CDBB469|nr:uncharacterized protein LOC122849609 [Aphidius gifuensis]
MDEEIKDLPPSKKRKISSSSTNESKKKFVEGWFKNPLFKNWIEKVNHDIHKVRCNKCKQNMTADISVLKKHIESTQHKKNTIVDKSTSKITQFIKSTDEDVKVKKLNESVKSAEIMLAAFFAEHTIPFRGFDHLVPVLKKMFPDSEIAKQLSIERTKGTEIIKNVIGETEKNELTQIMNKK